MKAKFLTVAPLLALSVLTSQAQAVDTTLTLSGQIAPVACALDVTGGGIYDYGDIQASTLAGTGAWGTTNLGSRGQDYTITCTGPMRVGLTLTDNRAGTAAISNIAYYGLGTDSSGANIGFNNYSILEAVINGVAGIYLSSTDRQTWTGQPSFNFTADNIISFSPTGGTSPVAITTVAGRVVIQANIADKSTLDLTRAINIDGSATMELVYL